MAAENVNLVTQLSRSLLVPVYLTSYLVSFGQTSVLNHINKIAQEDSLSCCWDTLPRRRNSISLKREKTLDRRNYGRNYWGNYGWTDRRGIWNNISDTKIDYIVVAKNYNPWYSWYWKGHHLHFRLKLSIKSIILKFL